MLDVVVILLQTHLDRHKLARRLLRRLVASVERGGRGVHGAVGALPEDLVQALIGQRRVLVLENNF